MKVLFGMVSLLVALAVAGVLAGKQLRAAGQGAAASAPSGASGATRLAPSRPLEERVRGDVVKALEEGARRNESDN
jgi:hypothetical protein